MLRTAANTFLEIFYALWHTSWVFMTTLKLWGLKEWVLFWCTSEKQKQIRFDAILVTVRGAPFFSKLTDVYVVLENLAGESYAFGSTALQANAVCIDVGAHIGAFSLSMASRNPGCRIYSFEPFRENYDILNENIRRNGLSNITAFNVAVAGDSLGRMLYVDAANTSAHSTTKRTGAPVSVDTTTLKEIFEGNRISRCDFLKMDCEGSEYDIVLSTPPEILARVDYIGLEYHVPSFYGFLDDTPLNDLVHRLRGNGFAVVIKKENYKRGYLYAQRKPS